MSIPKVNEGDGGDNVEPVVDVAAELQLWFVLLRLGLPIGVSLDVEGGSLVESRADL